MTGIDLSDHAMPGLAIVLEEKRFLTALAAAIKAKDATVQTPVSMQVVRMRYRPGQRAVLQVMFKYGQPAQRQLPASIWLFAGAKARKRMADGRDSHAYHEPLTDALVHFFPSDPHVPQIRAFTASPEMYAAQLSITGFDRIDVCRFRPGIGATFCCRRDGRRFAYVKIQKDRSARQSAEVLAKLQRASHGKSFTVPVLAGVDDSLNAYSMLAVDGVGFAEIFAQQSLHQVRTATHRLLRAMTEFHGLQVASDKVMDRNHLVSQSLGSASSIAALVPEHGAEAQALAARIEGLSVKLAAMACHGDMKPEHAILSSSNVALLDLDCFAIGDPLYDLAMLDVRVVVLAAASNIAEHRVSLVGSMIADAAKVEGESSAWGRFHWLKACAALQVAKHYSQKLDQAARRMAAFAISLGHQSMEQLNGRLPSANQINRHVELESFPCA